MSLFSVLSFTFLLLACATGQGSAPPAATAQTPVALASPGAASLSAPSLFPEVNLEQTAVLIVDGVNRARSQSRLPPLQADPALTRLAQERSADMIARDYFSHDDPRTGEELLIIYLKRANISYRYAGENIAEIKNDIGWVPPPLTVSSRYNAQELANELESGWLNSPEHRANIMNSHYHRTGVGLTAASDGRRIVATQVFAD